MDKIKKVFTLPQLLRLIEASGKFLKYRRIFMEYVDTFYVDFKNGMLEAAWGNRWYYFVTQPADGIYLFA